MSKLHVEKKVPTKPKVIPFQSLRYPLLYVVCPRAVIDTYGHLPWVDVLRAAELGRDGLTITRERPHIWQGLAGSPPPSPPDVAYLAQGQYDFSEKTVLFLQNW